MGDLIMQKLQEKQADAVSRVDLMVARRPCFPFLFAVARRFRLRRNPPESAGNKGSAAAFPARGTFHGRRNNGSRSKRRFRCHRPSPLASGSPKLEDVGGREPRS